MFKVIYDRSQYVKPVLTVRNVESKNNSLFYKQFTSENTSQYIFSSLKKQVHKSTFKLRNVQNYLYRVLFLKGSTYIDFFIIFGFYIICARDNNIVHLCTMCLYILLSITTFLLKRNPYVPNQLKQIKRVQQLSQFGYKLIFQLQF